MNVWKKMQPTLVTSLVVTSNEVFEVNASPKSWWTPISYDPPMLVLSTKPGSDTSINIEQMRRFVLQLPPEEAAREVLHTAKPLVYGENELDDQGIPWSLLDIDDNGESHPYVPAWPWLYCEVQRDIRHGEGAGDHNLWIAEVMRYGGFHGPVTDVLLHQGRNQFVSVGEPFDVEPY